MTNRHLYFKRNNAGVWGRVYRQFRGFIACIIKTAKLVTALEISDVIPRIGVVSSCSNSISAPG